MLADKEKPRKYWVLIGIAALAVLLICVGVISSQNNSEDVQALEHHEEIARLHLEDDGPRRRGPPKRLLRRRNLCKRAANSIASRLSKAGLSCGRLGRVNKLKCIRAIKNVYSFPLLLVVDEPKEFVRSRKPVIMKLDCADDLFKFFMGKSPKTASQKIRIGFTTKGRVKVLDSGCTRKGLSAFLQPPREVVKFNGFRRFSYGHSAIVKIDAKRVGRKLKISKMVYITFLKGRRPIRRRRRRRRQGKPGKPGKAAKPGKPGKPGKPPVAQDGDFEEDFDFDFEEEAL